MTNYEYYKKHYASRTIPEEYFEGAVERARVVLNKIESICKVKKCNLTREFALYRMAEEIHRDDLCQNVAQRTVGAVSIRYVDPRP